MHNILTKRFKEEEEKLVAIIREACSPVKIFLLGSTLLSRTTETAFMPYAPVCGNIGHYYVLVIVNGNKGHNEVQDKVENRCNNFIATTAIICSKDQFDKWLLEGHAFPRIVNKKAIILYGEKKIQQPLDDSKYAAVEKKNNEIYSTCLNRAEAFLAGAELYLLRKQNNMAAFMLHQSIEQILIGILRLKTGLRVNTHNLDKLYRYCCMVCYKLPEIILGDNNRTRQLFYLLQKAYADARYNDDYSITAVDIKAAQEVVKKLNRLARTITSTNSFEAAAG